MATKLAGQRAKYTKALADFNATDDEGQRLRPARHMLEVIQEAPGNGFSEADVTTGRQPPSEVLHLMAQGLQVPAVSAEDPERLVQQLAQMVDVSDLWEEGQGGQFVYAYGYRCRLVA